MARKIVVDNKTYQWRVGKDNIVIRGDGYKHVISIYQLGTEYMGMKPYDIEKMSDKHSFHITPDNIRKVIENTTKEQAK